MAISLARKLTKALELAQDIALQSRPDARGWVTLRVQSTASHNQYRRSDVDTRYGRRGKTGQFSWKSPWEVVGRFVFKQRITYAELWGILKRWNTPKLEKAIDPDRLARMVVEYEDADGTIGQYTLAATLAWAYVLSRASSECNPRAGKSLAVRYKDSAVRGIWIWLSADLQRGITPGRIKT